MTTPSWSDTAIELIAHRFKLLSEPSRLRLLYALAEGEMTVGELVEVTHMAQANVSHQLLILADGGVVIRRRTHRNVVYSLADASFTTLRTMIYRSLLTQGSEVLTALRDTPVTSEERAPTCVVDHGVSITQR